MERERTTAARWLVAVTLLCWASAAYAQTTSLDREVKAAPGHEVRVGIYTSMRPDCTSGPLPAIRLSVTPEHGTVTVRRATLKATNVKQCLAAELPALVAFYRPKADSANDDRFELEVSFTAGRKQIQRFHVIISTGAGEGQRI
jgi:predicted metal-binding membrane protein